MKRDVPGLPALTAQEKKRGMIVFAGLVVASLLVHNVWTYSGQVAPAVTSPDTLEAVFYRKMASQGDAGGMFLLATLHLAGRGVTKDLVEAHKWFNLAASRASTENYRRYASFRGDAARAMTPQQVTDAQKRAREWLAAFENRRK